MSDEPKRRHRAWIFWAALITLLVLYPLSLGPAFRLVWTSQDDPANLRVFKVVYRPISWARMHSETVTNLTDWYMSFCMPPSNAGYN
jgi:hypothetical protein